MRKLVYLLLVIPFVVVAAQADSALSKDPRLANVSGADLDAIEATALDYIDGYYTGDGERMARALHPELAKRIVRNDPRTGESVLQNMDAKALINMTKAGGGSQMYTVEQRRSDVEILDVYENVASVKIVATDWIDYLHVGMVDGEWKIINVLWELTPEAMEKFAQGQ